LAIKNLGIKIYKQSTLLGKIERKKIAPTTSVSILSELLLSFHCGQKTTHQILRGVKALNFKPEIFMKASFF
jgi:hypothetical protein